MDDCGDLFVELADDNIIRTSIVAMLLDNLIEEGKLENFLEFARKQAKKDGMDSDDLMGFFDELEKKYLSDDNLLWYRMLDALQKTTGCKVQGFKGDSCIVIENEEMDANDCREYLVNEYASKINLETMNQAVKDIGVKLEFIEAMNLPFDAGGFQNFCRFRVVKLE